MSSAGLRIGLFGGAFDPVHVGHQRVAESFLNSNLIDELHLLPTPHPPHKNLNSSASFEHRYEMLRLAFADYGQVLISDVEYKLPEPSYSLQTIEYLQKKNPGHIYFLCIGEDNLESFHKWYEYEKILEKVTLLVASRPGSTSRNQNSDILEKAIFVDHEELEISSTEIRAEEQLPKVRDIVPESVARYIEEHNLYQKS